MMSISTHAIVVDSQPCLDVHIFEILQFLNYFTVIVSLRYMIIGVMGFHILNYGLCCSQSFLHVA